MRDKPEAASSPNRQRVQGFTVDEPREDDIAVQVTCHACGGVHFVNPKADPANEVK